MKPTDPKRQRQPREGSPGRPPGQESAAAIGRRLREMYDGVLTEPVPDHLLALVAKLDGGPDGKP
ncbi:MAG: hypothetical protein KIT76_00955 [Pseudolabrys sp.]|nr:hypothetical protein [Pseudolabrys sp.]MCW5696126.1 hypothetical protein [Bauldia sp.]